MPKRQWEPSKSTVEKAPNVLQVSHEQPGVMCHPHWHAQIEVNFVLHGAVDYQMHGHAIRLERGSLALFWGGLPHQVVDTSPDPEYIAVHLPLVNFFRLRLPHAIQHRLIHGATLISAGVDEGDFYSFNRWSEYMRSGDPDRLDHAVDELLLRIERIPFEAYRLIDSSGVDGSAVDPFQQAPFSRVRHICDFIADNFRQNIGVSDIAVSADLHPKYAMSVFRRSTGMTLNEYLSLLRLSYAQALLISDNEANVLNVALESGFGSLSAFNKSFRKVTGTSPSDFRRTYLPRTIDTGRRNRATGDFGRSRSIRRG